LEVHVNKNRTLLSYFVTKSTTSELEVHLNKNRTLYRLLLLRVLQFQNWKVTSTKTGPFCKSKLYRQIGFVVSHLRSQWKSLANDPQNLAGSFIDCLYISSYCVKPTNKQHPPNYALQLASIHDGATLVCYTSHFFPQIQVHIGIA
jgi:hypothetical protein